MPSAPIVSPNRRFGPWLVLKWTRDGWSCQHDDGHTAVLSTSALTAATYDLKGARFGELTVTAHVSGRIWLCACTCGRRVKRRADQLASGKSLICQRGAHSLNKRRPIEYRAWVNMIHSGAEVEEDWRAGFKNFLADVGERPDDVSGVTLTRLDTKLGWVRGNVEWRTTPDKTKNAPVRSRSVAGSIPGRRARLLEVGGSVKSLAEWARHYGIDHRVVRTRLRDGWTVEQALRTPVASKSRRQKRQS